MATKFIRPKEAARRSGFHVVTIRRKARDPYDDFPALVRIGPCSFGIVESEFEAWANRRIAERDDVEVT